MSLRLRYASKGTEIDTWELEDATSHFIYRRQETAKTLKDLADKLNYEHNDAYLVKTVGGVTGIIGASVLIGGVVSSFFTFGASAIVTAIGSGIAAAGGVVNATGFFNDYRARLSAPGVSQVLAEDKKAFQRLTEVLTRAGLSPRPVDPETVPGWLAKSGRLALRGLSIYEIQSPLGLSHIVELPVDLDMAIVSSVQDWHNVTASEVVQEIHLLVDSIQCPGEDTVSHPCKDNLKVKVDQRNESRNKNLPVWEESSIRIHQKVH